MRGSLRLRVAISYSVLLILTIGMLSAYLWTFVRNSYLYNLRNNLLAETRLVAAEVSQGQNSSPSNAILEALVGRYKLEMNARVTFILPSGAVVGDLDQDPPLLDNYLSRPEVQQAMNGSETTITRFSQTLNDELLYSAVPITENGQVIGVA